MFFIAITPAFIWIILLAGLLLWMTLGYMRRTGVPFASAFYVLALAQSGVAVTALFLTAQRSISRAACMTGIIGAQANMVLGLALIGTVFAFLIAARPKIMAMMGGNKSLFASFALLQVVVTMVLLRSALLCTV